MNLLLIVHFGLHSHAQKWKVCFWVNTYLQSKTNLQWTYVHKHGILNGSKQLVRDCFSVNFYKTLVLSRVNQRTVQESDSSLQVFLPLYRGDTEQPERATHVIVGNTGEVNWFSHRIFRSSCSVDVALFPFDSQVLHVLNCVAIVHQKLLINAQFHIRRSACFRSASWSSDHGRTTTRKWTWRLWMKVLQESIFWLTMSLTR